jgi:hypothetical protein
MNGEIIRSWWVLALRGVIAILWRACTDVTRRHAS